MKEMLFASPGGDRLFIPRSFHYLVFDEDCEVPEDVFAPLQVDFAQPDGRKIAVLFEVDDDIGQMEIGDVPEHEHFMRLSGDSSGQILDRYIARLDEELGRHTTASDMSMMVYVLRVRVLEANMVERPEPTAAALGDLREWDE